MLATCNSLSLTQTQFHWIQQRTSALLLLQVTVHKVTVHLFILALDNASPIRIHSATQVNPSYPLSMNLFFIINRHWICDSRGSTLSFDCYFRGFVFSGCNPPATHSAWMTISQRITSPAPCASGALTLSEKFPKQTPVHFNYITWRGNISYPSHCRFDIS